MKMEDLFQGFNPSQYEDEARRQWDTQKRSSNRTSGPRYTPDWNALGAEQAAIYDDAYAALKAGNSR
jgi:hypothetical protein